jgi:hypothetical protein
MEDDTSSSGGVGYQYYRNGTRFQLPADTELVFVGHFTRAAASMCSNAAYLQDSRAASPA